MRQGLLCMLLLGLSFLMTSLHALELSDQEIIVLMSDSGIGHTVDDLYQKVVKDDITGVKGALERIPMPKQEVVRYQLLQMIERNQLILTPRLAIFIREQSQFKPVYTRIDNGDGYRATMPAFNYALIAHRLNYRWQNDQKVIEFVLAVEQQQLVLSQWLKGEPYQVSKKEQLLISELDSLSQQAIDYLVGQLIGGDIITWLPSSEVLIKLARVSDDDRVYALLWRMKQDEMIRNEVLRLSKQQDEQSLSHLIMAAQNPALKELVIKQLVLVRPMTQPVKDFLVTKLDNADDGYFVAQQLASGGHSDLLRQLVDHGATELQRSHVNMVLSIN